MPELSVVVPAYNEAGAIADVISAWTAEFERLGIDYLMTVYDDGSRDDTAEVVRRLASNQPRLQLRSHANRGHGPTILRGYQEADGEWVFQIDSDGEVRPDEFGEFWRHRDQHDLLLGRRTGRASPLARRLVTRLAHATVRVLFGGGIEDVNTPYRLMRRTALARLLPFIPTSAFAPNVILSGLAVSHGMRVIEYPVQHHARVTGRGSLSAIGALRAGLRSLREAVTVRIHMTRNAAS